MGLRPSVAIASIVAASILLPSAQAAAPTISPVEPGIYSMAREGDRIHFQARSEDRDGNLNRTRFFYNGQLEYTRWCESPCFLQYASWEHVLDGPGDHVVIADARDQLGGKAESVTWLIRVIRPPTATAVSPQQNITISVGESLGFELSASDDDGDLSGVEFFVGAARMATLPCQGSCEAGRFNWPYTFEEMGTFSVRALAVDTSGASSQPVAWAIDVGASEDHPQPTPENRPPILRAQSPAADVVVDPGQAVRFRLAAEDLDSNLHRIDLWINGKAVAHVVCRNSCYFKELEWVQPFPNGGTYEVTSRAQDILGLEAALVSWTVTVRAPPPQRPPAAHPAHDQSPPSPSPTYTESENPWSDSPSYASPPLVAPVIGDAESVNEAAGWIIEVDDWFAPIPAAGGGSPQQGPTAPGPDLIFLLLASLFLATWIRGRRP